MNFKDKLITFLTDSTKLTSLDIARVLSVPPDPKLGDFAFPCFLLAKEWKMAPPAAAAKLKDELKFPSWIARVDVAGPYLNFFLDKAVLATEVLTAVQKEKETFGHQTLGKGKSIVIDFSSPNIAKPFGIGHLRSTIIGNCLYKVNKALGYNVIGVNHLGDWGTQFGKMIVAFRKWGDTAKLEEKPIEYLLSLYVRFHKEAESNDSLNEEAREAFKALEEGDTDALALWQQFRDLSLAEFQRMYDLLDVQFDSFHGEAFYNDKTEAAIQTLQETVKTTVSEGALIVDLEEYKMPPVLLRKSDGSTMYHTRDIAAAYYRLQEYSPSKILYVVGTPQQLHFAQLFKTMELAGVDPGLFEHVNFGLIKLADGKMSTRKGTLILLDEVLHKAITKVGSIIEDKNPDLAAKDAVAEQVGVGAIIFADLHTDRIRDVVFDWEKILSFEGETGPYLQYTHARACSILRKVGVEVGERSAIDYSLLTSNEAKQVLLQIAAYPQILQDVSRQNKPHLLANHLIRLAQLFNEFYAKNKVLSDDDALQTARLALVDALRQVLANGLRLLGIAAPEEM